MIENDNNLHYKKCDTNSQSVRDPQNLLPKAQQTPVLILDMTASPKIVSFHIIYILS